MSRTICFRTLGCAKNRVDTEVSAAAFLQRGWDLEEDASLADCIVVNTCGFIRPAVEESIDELLTLSGERKEGALLVVAGCMVERYGQDLMDELPEVDLFHGLLGSPDLLYAVEELIPPEHTSPIEPTARLLTTSPGLAYLKIAEGCSRRCAFCTIPAIRGAQRSRPVVDVVREARQLITSMGTEELVIIAQDTGSYGTDRDDGASLPFLLQRLDALPVSWIRLMYLNPDGVTPELLEAMAKARHVLPYVDIPVQHASVDILRRMRRPGSHDQLLEQLHSIRRALPDAVLRTTVITGFPGEEELHFKELCGFLEAARFDHLGVFAYSPEEGTRAAELDRQVPEEVAQARRDQLLDEQQQRLLQSTRRWMERPMEALVEGQLDDDVWLGRLWFQAPEVDGVVTIEAPPGSLEPGTIATVEITGGGPYDFEAEPRA